MLLLKIAFRNLFRQKRRSLFTGAGMVLGYVLISFTVSLTEGTYEQIINGYTGSHTGHLQVHQKDYLEAPSLYKLIDRPHSVYSALRSEDQVRSFAPRVISGALAYHKNHSTGVLLRGISPEREELTTKFSKLISRGTGFTEDDEHTIIITQQLTKTLKAQIGDELVFISQGADGSIANDLYRIKGVIDEKEQGVEPNLVLMPLKTLQEFLALEDRIHEIAVVLESYKGARAFSQKFAGQLQNPQLSVDSWQVVIKEFYAAMEADKKGNNISLAIIVVVVSIGILNTILMSVLERTREFGVLKAIGTSPRQVFSLIVLENLIMSAMSFIVGLVIALGLNYYFTVNEILLAEPLSYGGLSFTGMKTTMTLYSFTMPAFVVFFSAFMVSLWPGYRAASVLPVEAMRS